MLESTADAVNVIGNFLGVRDVNALTQEAVFNKYQIKQVDVLVLFGGSILEGGNVLAQAIKEKIAKKYIIVGGAGHTTETLRQKMQKECSKLDTIFLCFLKKRLLILYQITSLNTFTFQYPLF